MDQRKNTPPRQGARNARGRAVSLAAAGLVFLAGLVFSLGGGSGQAAATPGLSFHGEEITLLVPTDQGDTYVRITMLLADDGSGSFDDVLAEARTEALAGFPGAVELEEGEVTAAFAAFTSWDPPTANWSYNGDGEPGGLNAGSVIASAANSWNGAGGSPWSFTGGGSTSVTPNVCTNNGGDGQSVVAWTDSLGGSTLARTCTWFSPTATEFDMVFSGAWNWTVGTPIQTDLRTVATHEFGHALGLLHTQGSHCPGTAMCGSYNSGTSLNGPQADDVAGVVALYGGSGGPPSDTPTPLSTSTPVPPPPPAPTATDTPIGGAPETATPTSGGAAPPPPPPAPTQVSPTTMPPPAVPTSEPEKQTFFVPGVARD